MESVLRFRKSFEKFVPFKRIGNYRLKELDVDSPLSSLSNSEIIQSIIGSHFYFWGGEGHPSGHTFSSSTKHLDGSITNETITNNKFHGFYSVDKLADTDYKLIDRNLFNGLFKKAVKCYSEGDPNYLHEAQKYINEYLTDNSLIFHLEIDEAMEDDKRDEHSVFGIFMGFLIVDRKQNKVAILEVGDE